MAKKGQKFSKYSAEYKLLIVIDKLENKLSYSAVAKKYWNLETKQLGSYISTIKRWERQYLENGLAGLLKEYRGRPHKVKGEDVKEKLPKKQKENYPRKSLNKTPTQINSIRTPKPTRNKVMMRTSSRNFVRELSE